MVITTTKATVIAALVLVAGAVTDATFNSNLILTQAEAVIGRPATPLSYAGVARRTTRRMVYATSVYVATLPAGCTKVVIEGVSLHQCGASYYQPSGGQYVVVRIE